MNDIIPIAEVIKGDYLEVIDVHDIGTRFRVTENPSFDGHYLNIVGTTAVDAGYLFIGLPSRKVKLITRGPEPWTESRQAGH